MEPEDKNMSDTMFAIYGINAAHYELPVGHFYNVTYNGTTISVQINNLTSHGKSLELSKEAAEALKITGIVPCRIEMGPKREELTWGFMIHVAVIYLCAAVILLAIQ